MRVTLFALLLLLGVYGDLFAQQHYVVVVDRISNQRNYYRLDIVAGRPVENAITTPHVKNGDIITIRITNFNELIYGFEIQDQLIAKTKNNVAAQLLENPLLGNLSLSPALRLLTGILENPPAPSRGEEVGPSINTVYDGYVGLLKKLSSTEQALTMVYDEGATLPDLKSQLTDLERKYNKTVIAETIDKLSTDLKTVSSMGSDALLDSIGTGLKQLQSLERTDFLSPDLNFRTVKTLINSVDFVVEKTLIVGGKDNIWDNGGSYEKYLAYIFIYKRAEPISSVAALSPRPYNYDRGGYERGDFLRQALLIDLKVKNKRKPFWSMGVAQIFTPQNSFKYELSYNNSSEDSLKFRSNNIGGTKTIIMTDLNFPLPLRSEKLDWSALIGLGVAIQKNTTGKLSGNLDFSQAFVTTGLGCRLSRFPFLSLKAGLGWAKYQRLDSKYQADKWYRNDLSDAALESAVTKKLKVSPFIGLGLNF